MEESYAYNQWFIEHVTLQYAAQAMVHGWLENFKEFPPRAKAASFTIDQIVETMMPRDSGASRHNSKEYEARYSERGGGLFCVWGRVGVNPCCVD